MDLQQPQIETDPKILELLEKKRKGVRQNGLLQFILWREALKAEKDRSWDEGSQQQQFTKAMLSSNKRRLSFT